MKRLDVLASSRASSLPQVVLAIHEFCVHRPALCGSELARDGVSQSVRVLDGPASSRAGSLPQVILAVHEFCVHRPTLCGSELARDSSGAAHINASPDRFCFAFDLDLDLGAPLNHAGRTQALRSGLSRHGCRDSRAGPWMALRGGPRSNAFVQACRA